MAARKSSSTTIVGVDVRTVQRSFAKLQGAGLIEKATIRTELGEQTVGEWVRLSAARRSAWCGSVGAGTVADEIPV